MFNLPTLFTILPVLVSLIDPAAAFDYKSAIQRGRDGPTAARTGVIPNRYVLEFDTSEDARQVAKRDRSVSVSLERPDSFPRRPPRFQGYDSISESLIVFFFLFVTFSGFPTYSYTTTSTPNSELGTSNTTYLRRTIRTCSSVPVSAWPTRT
jgi:hypothetical protein